MPEFIHDIEALRTLKTELANVYRDIMDSQRSDFELSVSEAGHIKAMDAITSFYEGWNDGRKKVRDSLYDRVQDLKIVISRYEELEQQLAGAFGASADAGRAADKSVV